MLDFKRVTWSFFYSATTGGGNWILRASAQLWGETYDANEIIPDPSAFLASPADQFTVVVGLFKALNRRQKAGKQVRPEEDSTDG